MPTIMLPTAIGRTMKRQTEVAMRPASSSGAPAGRKACNCGPRKKISSGIISPQANTLPAKLSDASSGPMM